MGEIPQGPTFNQGSMANQAEAYYPQAERSYANVVLLRDNRSTHSIELIKSEYRVSFKTNAVIIGLVLRAGRVELFQHS